jgi:hypothetical protein
MKIAKAVAIIGLLAMTGILIYAFTTGNFAADGQKLLALPWGIVSLVDLYVGFSLFSCWIVYREKSPWVAALWVVLIMTLGFWAGSLYTFLALNASQDDWKRFWLGKHFGSAKAPAKKR